MASKRLLADQVKFRLEAGWPDINEAVMYDDIYIAIGQIINSMFQMEHFSVTLPSGETIPDALSLATYEGVAVESLPNGRSRATMPVMPRSLPRNIGCFDIQDPNGFISFIPLLPTQRMLLKSQPLINDLLGQVGFENKGKVVEFTKDLRLLDIDTVNMQLVVTDISTFGETDELPLPPNQEKAIIDELMKQFTGVEQLANVKEGAKV